jgi:hypothetical protein
MSTFYVSRPLRVNSAIAGGLNASTNVVTGPPAATGFTLTGPTSGTTGQPATYTVTPNGVVSGTVVVTPAASNSGSVAPLTLTFTNSSTAQTFTVTRSTDGTSTISITNNGGLSNGAPISFSTTTGVVSVGALVHDGPETPEQIALWLPTTGTVAQTATATCRYRRVGDVSYTTGHPLYRIRPTMSETPNVGTVQDGFAWVIIDLQPGTQYEVEVTVSEGAATVVKTLTHTTRALPATAGTPNKTISAGASAATINTMLAGLNPGDVMQIADGTYSLSTSLVVNRSGTSGSPIYIRGASRAGVVLSNSGDIIRLAAVSNVVIENLSMQGSGVDGGTAPGNGSCGIRFNDDQVIDAVTIRNVVMTGVDRAIGPSVTAPQRLTRALVYDCTLTGNNQWNATFTDSNLAWDDDGINLSGQGNCAFNNTVQGFGDSFAYASSVAGGGNQTMATIGVHFYRNDMLHGEDDGTEADYSLRNNTFYDNRLTNSMTALSLDPLYGGPFIFARNLSINAGRQPFKWNSFQSGQFVYNNTIVHTTTRYATTDPAAESGWYQANNGDQNALGVRNNILVYRGSGTRQLRLDNATTSWTTIDWTHNAYYPNLLFNWPTSSYANLAAAQSGLPNSTPVFSGTNRRMLNDNITVNNPWVETVTLGADYHTKVTTQYALTLSLGDVTKNSGVVIPNITDGFSGAAPDRGAVIEGRSAMFFGDRSNLPTWAQGASGTITVINSGTTVSSAASAAGAGSYPLGSSDLCAAWSGGALVSIGGRPYLVVCGNGHTDGSWNGRLKFGPLTGSNSPTWSVWQPASAVGAVRVGDTYSDGRQSACHTYNHLVGVGSSLYAMSTDAYYDTGSASSKMYRITDGATPTETFLTNRIGNGFYGAAAHYQGKIYYVSGNGVFERLRIYTIATNSWASESNGDVALFNYLSMAIDTTRGKILVTDGQSAYYWDVATLTRRAVNVPSGYTQCLEYDAVRDAFVVPVAGSASVRECSAASLAAGNTPSWTTRTFTGTAPSAFPAAGTFGRWRWVPELGGAILVPNSTANVWFYKS